MEIKIHKDTTIYILCPPKYATGGTELLHQLSDALLKNDVDARLFYWPKAKNPTSPEFVKYQINIATDIQDVKENVFIAPEIDNFKIFEYENIQKAIWWLSVDNYFKNVSIRKNTLKLRLADTFFRRKLFNFQDSRFDSVKHFAQSYYAKKFLESKGIQDVKMLTDYINDRFFSTSFEISNKEDIVLYNPKKGIEFTQKLIKMSGDAIRWIPIQNLSREGVVDLLKKAKVYIDFGNHPGKDRFPREAAVLGCCIITNKEGSAGNNKDLPIPERYKFEADANNLNSIVDRITECLTEYENVHLDFESYRAQISEEKNVFFKEVNSLFVNQ
jgi:hypothetical protein